MNSIREIPPEYLIQCPIIDDKYKVLFKLGTGRFSKVKMAINLQTHERVAVKIMKYKPVQINKGQIYQQKALKTFLNQVRMILKVKHKFIIQIIDFKVGGFYRIADGTSKRILYYVMKIANNGQLFRIIKQTQIFTEKTARYIFKQLITGLQHLHKNGIAHRDLKAENILIDSKFNIKIADFGYSCVFLDCQSHKIQFDAVDEVGSMKCNAPELTNSQCQGVYHADQIDLFACGCILFQMVMKVAPFKSSNYKDQFYKQLIKKDNHQFWTIFSANCSPSIEFRDLIQKLLDPNPKIRLDLLGVKKHPWFKNQLCSKKQYQKDISNRLKKVTTKIRKQQQQQIKLFFKAGKSELNHNHIKQHQIILPRAIQQQIIQLYSMLTLNQSNKSDSSSTGDARQYNEEDYKSCQNKLQ